MVGLVITEGASRLLAFAFYLLAARVLTTSGYGEVQYTITLATLAFGVIQVITIVLPRELGASRTAGSARVDQVLGTGLLLAAVTWGMTVTIAGVAAATGLTGTARPVGLMAVISGLAVFQLYYSVARGLGRFKRAAFTYAGASAVQLAAFAAATVLVHPSASEALLIFSVSSFVPVVLLEIRHPIFRHLRMHAPAELRNSMLRAGGVLLVAQLAYLVWFSADQIWVDGTLGASALGIYGAAKTLSQLFVVLPAGVNGVLMPRVAELRTARDPKHANKLVVGASTALLLASLIVAVLIVVARVPLLDLLFGSKYGGAADALVGLTVAMVLFGIFMTLTQSAIGWGRPHLYSVTIAVAAMVEVAGLIVLPGRSIEFAAWVYAGSIAIATAVVACWLLLRPFALSAEGSPRDRRGAGRRSFPLQPEIPGGALGER
jgi:O-antigen/teichoic acid export membrane protein